MFRTLPEVLEYHVEVPKKIALGLENFYNLPYRGRAPYCTPVLQLINIFWLDLTLLIGPGLRSGYGTPLDLVIWLLWSTSTKVNQEIPC